MKKSTGKGFDHSCLVVTKGHTFLNKPAVLAAVLFKYILPFVTTRHERVKNTQLTFVCLKSTKETLQKVVKYVQS